MSRVTEPREEFVPAGRAIWQTNLAKTYRCPYCARPIFTQYEGDDSPTRVECERGIGHRVVWERVALS